MHRACVCGCGHVVAFACTQAHIVSLLFILRNQMPFLFTHAEEVVDLACHTLPFTMASLLASGITSVFSGALRGTGRQKWGALLNLTACKCFMRCTLFSTWRGLYPVCRSWFM